MKKEKLCVKCGKPIIDRDRQAKQCWQCYSERSYKKKKVIESPQIRND